jgi:ATP-dependent helicase/nuclease subunit B
MPRRKRSPIAVALREAVHESKTRRAGDAGPCAGAPRRRRARALEHRGDDSGGDALPDTEAGVFARLAAQAALDDLPPVTLLALVKHARFRLGAAVARMRARSRRSSLRSLRGPRPRPA